MRVCPVCRAACNGPFLRRGDVSIHQNLLVDDPAAARALRNGTLEMHACRECGFVFNAAFEPERLRYGAAYDNTQTLSPAFERHVDGLAARLLQRAGPGPHRIVEVGCGKGGFLRLLVERHAGSEGVGFDPSYLGADSDLDGRLRFERRFYDSSCARPDTDVIVCRHVIEHIADPVGLLRTVRQTVGSSGTRVFFETPCVEWILENQVVWDFFYEHCSYFSAGALRYAFEAAGFAVDDIAHVFGGQYLWIEAHPIERPLPPPVDDDSVAREAASLAAHETALIQGLRAQLADLLQAGPVAICGAGAKGVTLAGLIDPDCRLVACIADLNPNKQGRYLPGTGHPIVSPRDLAGFGVKSALVTNPNYLRESSQLLREIGLDIELVNLMRAEADADTH